MRTSLSLRSVLTRLVFVAGIVPLLGSLLVLFLWLLPTLQSQMIDSNRGLALALATQTEKSLLPPHAALRKLAGRIDAYEKQGLLQASFDTLLAASDMFEAVYLVDQEQRLRALSVPDELPVRRSDFIGIDLSGYAVLQKAGKLGAPEWSDVYRSPISDRSVVASVVPAGKRLLVAELSLGRLSEFVQRLAGERSTMFILDSHGRVVAHPDARLAVQQVNYSNLPIVKKGEAVTTMQFVLDGREVIATRVPIRELEWQVLVTQPLADARRPVAVIMATMIALALAAGVVALVFGVMFARRVAARFERLAGLSEELAKGHYPQQWPEQDLVEAETLNIGLQRMFEAVQEREEAWRDLSQTLEDRVTERTTTLQQAQESLGRAERLAALGSLVAGVAHELNTPIGNGLITTTALQDKVEKFGGRMVGGLRRSDLEEFVADCRHASDLLARNLFRASELVTSFKQVAVDQTTSQRRQFELSAIVREIALAMHPMLNKQRCVLDFDGVPGEIWLDSYPGPLGQVLVNLLTNAMIHGYDGHPGRIALSVSRLPGERAQIIVSDQGAGIPAQHLGRIFDPFFTTRLGQGGSGLGLHICYNIISNLLGGTITVQSEEGQGATFTVTLPLQAPPQPEPAEDG